jgi:hypothetical protein
MDDKWMGGIEMLPLSAVGATGVVDICASTEMAQLQREAGVRFQPFTIYATDNCSTFGSGSVDFRERARQKLSVVESFWLERELWENTLAATTPAFVTDTSTTVGAGLGAVAAFSALDAAVASDLQDGRGMIHITLNAFEALQAETSMFRREGNVWYSPLDNIVVPGRGYTGNGPNPGGGANENAATATVVWAFGHPGIIQITRGAIQDLGTSDAELARSINDKMVYAERSVGMVIPHSSGFYAASLDLATIPNAAGSLATVTPLFVDETSYAAARSYLGYSLYNDSGVAVQVFIYNGSDNTGPLLDVVSLVDGESAREWYEPGMATNGIYVDVVGGALNASSTIRYLV